MSTQAIPPQPTVAPATRGVAMLCALAVWLLGLLAVSPQLHAALHSESDQADHTCAVTLFSHGVESAATDANLASAPALFFTGDCSCQPALPVAGRPYRLPPGCGPPLN